MPSVTDLCRRSFPFRLHAAGAGPCRQQTFTPPPLIHLDRRFQLGPVFSFSPFNSSRTMASSSLLNARLARLNKLVQSDLAALPDRTFAPPQATGTQSASDDDTPGGILLVDDATSKQSTPALAPAPDTRNLAPSNSEPSSTAALSVNEERRFVWIEGATSSFNLAPMPKPVARPVQLPPTTLAQGEIADQKSFAPIVALSRYPYKYCIREHSQNIASAFFDAGKFWAREWDL